MRTLLFGNSLFKYNIYVYLSLLIFSILNITYGFYIETKIDCFYGGLFSYIFFSLFYYLFFLFFNHPNKVS